MHPWNCCRMCASTRSLHPIFISPEQSVKYSNAVFLTTGIKVTMNDSLPQEICSACISFINESIKFRRKCEDIQKQLLDKKINGIKIENINNVLKTEDTSTSIDITDALDEDFKDYDDNITLDTLQMNKILKDNDECSENINEMKDKIDYETRVIEIEEKPLDIMFKSKRKTRSVKIKRKESKEAEKTERVREEIECEYCHKILTSKLSLRNHYKIHTGFDVVCEHCGKKFITRRLLLMHCRAKHGYEKTDKCSYCDYKASNAEQVKIHERLHTGEKPFVCKECNAGFHRKSSYLQHIAIHLPEKTVQCDQCTAKFKSVTLMRIHKNRHRPSQYTFKCGVCDNSFARRRNVARHLQRVHGLPPDHQIHRIKIH